MCKLPNWLAERWWFSKPGAHPCTKIVQRDALWCSSTKLQYKSWQSGIVLATQPLSNKDHWKIRLCVHFLYPLWDINKLTTYHEISHMYSYTITSFFCTHNNIGGMNAVISQARMGGINLPQSILLLVAQFHCFQYSELSKSLLPKPLPMQL